MTTRPGMKRHLTLPVAPGIPGEMAVPERLHHIRFGDQPPLETLAFARIRRAFQGGTCHVIALHRGVGTW